MNQGPEEQSPMAQEWTAAPGAAAPAEARAGDCGCPPDEAPGGAWQEEPGATLGPYKLLQRIGEGGFGVVYMAEQREPVRRKVALKLIKPGMDSRQVIARFEAERQALAMMDHPNIARVLDAGTTRQARPYFVMELVKGVPITRYCDTEQLSTPERLGLFMSVCRAVQHAHTKGIIHRDLKPSNVLVTLHDGHPVPKVIDFGIAKATNAELTARTLFTEYRQFIGTPEYMSPEQAEMSGLDIDTRSDIYSLGVLLYELLVGVTPFERERLQSAALNEIQRIIREEDPPRPSTRLSSLEDGDSQAEQKSGPRRSAARGTGTRSSIQEIARQRRTDPQHLARQLRGDLDWIVMKALEKDRTRRYETASALAEDIERHLNDQPVSAGPPSASYRLGKFYRRNRGRVVAAAAVAAALLLGLGGTSYGMLWAFRSARAAEQAMTRAEEQAAIAHAVHRFLNEDLLAAVAPEAGGRNVTVREVLDEASEQIDNRFGDEPAVQAAIHGTIGRSYMELGQLDSARPHLQRAAEIHRRVHGDAARETIQADGSVAALALTSGQYAEAERVIVDAMARARAALGPADKVTIGLGINLSIALTYQGRYGEAQEQLRETLADAERGLGEDHEYTLKALGTLANLADDMGREQEAERLFNEVLVRQERSLGKEHPDALMSRANLASLYITLGRLEESVRLHRDVLEARRRLLGEEHPDTLSTLANFALAYRTMGQYQEAEPLLQQAHRVALKVLGPDHSHTLIMAGSLADTLAALQRPTEAEPLYLRAVEGLTASLGEDHPETMMARADLMRFYRALGRTADIERLAPDHVRALVRAAGRASASADALNNAASELLEIEVESLRDPATALALAQRACDLTNHENYYYLDTLACALAATGDPTRAIEVQNRALELAAADDPNRPALLEHMRQFEQALVPAPQP